MALVSPEFAVAPLLAQAAAGGTSAQMAVYVVALGAIMYFFMIRPQLKEQKDAQNMLSALKKGDEVFTTGGVIGRIFAVDEKGITLDVGGGVKLRVLKQSIKGKMPVEPAKADGAEAKKEEK